MQYPHNPHYGLPSGMVPTMDRSENFTLRDLVSGIIASTITRSRGLEVFSFEPGLDQDDVREERERTRNTDTNNNQQQ